MAACCRERSPRAWLEPVLAAWAAAMLGDPAGIRCAIRIPSVDMELSMSLADFAASQSMSALDAVLERLSAWEARARAFVLARNDFVGFEDDLRRRDPGRGHGYALIGGARPMDALDLTIPGPDVETGLDLRDAESCLATFRNGLLSPVSVILRPGIEGQGPGRRICQRRSQRVETR